MTNLDYCAIVSDVIDISEKFIGPPLPERPGSDFKVYKVGRLTVAAVALSSPDNRVIIDDTPENRRLYIQGPRDRREEVDVRKVGGSLVFGGGAEPEMLEFPTNSQVIGADGEYISGNQVFEGDVLRASPPGGSQEIWLISPEGIVPTSETRVVVRSPRQDIA